MILVVDPGQASTNLGDQIISEAIKREFIDPVVNAGRAVEVVAMHGAPSASQLEQIDAAEEVVVSGTNLLSDHMRFGGSWDWPSAAVERARGKLTFFGVGWWQYQTLGIDPLSRRWLKSLMGDRPWAVRDLYSQRKLERAGVPAVHLSCPTLWTVSAQVLPLPNRHVIATFSDYNQDLLADAQLVKFLHDTFSGISYWPQGPGDRAYIELIDRGEYEVIGSSLADFDAALARPHCVYVGLRLHAGIRAMQKGVPSLVLSVDNRAAEIGRSVGLVAPSRNALREIRASMTGEAVHLELPRRAIDEWMGSW